jgi:hypothetical protein
MAVQYSILRSILQKCRTAGQQPSEATVRWQLASQANTGASNYYPYYYWLTQRIPSTQGGAEAAHCSIVCHMRQLCKTARLRRRSNRMDWIGPDSSQTAAARHTGKQQCAHAMSQDNKHLLQQTRLTLQVHQNASIVVPVCTSDCSRLLACILWHT